MKFEWDPKKAGANPTGSIRVMRTVGTYLVLPSEVTFWSSVTQSVAIPFGSSVRGTPTAVNGNNMKSSSKKSAKPSHTTAPPDIDFSGGVRGKYAARYAESTNVVVLSPDVAEVFPNSEAVNEALRTLVRLSGKTVQMREAHTGKARRG